MVSEFRSCASFIVHEYVLCVNVLCGMVVFTSRTVTNKEKLMYVLVSLDESFDSIFVTLTKKMLTKRITLDDAKVLMLSHESRLTRRKTTLISPFPSVNFAAKIDVVIKTSNEQS